MATVVMVIIGLLWIPVIQGGKGLYDYLQGIQAYLAPPIFVVFFFGIFMKRLNGKGCLATLITGFIMGLFRLVVDTPVKLSDNFTYTKGSFLWIVNNIFFQYYSLLITIVCIIVFIGVSYATKAPDYAKISGLTFSTLTDKDKLESRSTWSVKDIIFSVLLIVAILCIYLYFRG
jgi:SSS family solute:Na+ symporter